MRPLTAQDELIGGFVGTLAHTTVMLTTFFGLLAPLDQATPLPPYLISTFLFHWVTGIDTMSLSRSSTWILVTIAHFSYGIISGLAYRWFQLRYKLRPLLRGLEFGLLYWAVNYLGWVPLSGAYNLFLEKQPKHVMIMISACLAYGVAMTYTINFLRTRVTKRELRAGLR